jgi:hypothetical protein
MMGSQARKLMASMNHLLIPVLLLISFLLADIVLPGAIVYASSSKAYTMSQVMASFIDFLHKNHSASMKASMGPYTTSHQRLPNPGQLRGQAASQYDIALDTSNAPGHTTSRYISPNDVQNPQQLAQDGCSQASNGESGLVILDFGEPWQDSQGNYGTLLPNYPDAAHFVSTTTIAIDAEWFLWGYGQCAKGNQMLLLGVGTNNAGSNVTQGQGNAWAMAVNNVNGWIMSQGFSNREYAVGASDIEVEYNSPATTQTWVNGYASSARSVYFDYGDASGCPEDDSSTNRPCSNNWMQGDVVNAAWANGAGIASPQIYNTQGDQAKAWQSLDYYARTNSNSSPNPSGSMPIAGSLTQWGACHAQGHTCDPTTENSPDQGWQQLNTALTSSQVTTQNLPFSSDITWDS